MIYNIENLHSINNSIFNLSDNNSITLNDFLNDYKKILGGVPQTLVSKFKISYNLLLNLYFTNNMNFNDFANNSMITNDITKNIKVIENDIEEINKE